MAESKHVPSKEAQDMYTALLHTQNIEKRNKRMQVVIKPSTFACLEELQKAGVIKSKNDLINNFLEEFVRRYLEQKE